MGFQGRELPSDEPSLKTQPFSGTIPAWDVWVGVGGQPGLAWPESRTSVCSGVESTNVMQSENGLKPQSCLCSSRPRLKRTEAKLCLESSNPRVFHTTKPRTQPTSLCWRIYFSLSHISKQFANSSNVTYW